MNFHEKLSKLIEGRRKAEVSRSASLPANAIANIINSGNIPRIDTASRIARALNVDVGWLVDDDRPWPPPFQDLPDSLRRRSHPTALQVTAEAVLSNVFQSIMRYPSDEWEVRLSLQLCAMDAIIKAGTLLGDVSTTSHGKSLRSFLAAKRDVLRPEFGAFERLPLFASRLAEMEQELEESQSDLENAEMERDDFAQKVKDLQEKVTELEDQLANRKNRSGI